MKRPFSVPLEHVPHAELHLPPRREVLVLTESRKPQSIDSAPGVRIVAHEAKHRRADVGRRDPGLPPLLVDQVEHVVHVRSHLERLAGDGWDGLCQPRVEGADRKSTRLNSSHLVISYAVFCLKKKKQ